jgi:hypothetical protein
VRGGANNIEHARYLQRFYTHTLLVLLIATLISKLQPFLQLATDIVELQRLCIGVIVVIIMEINYG